MYVIIQNNFQHQRQCKSWFLTAKPCKTFELQTQEATGLAELAPVETSGETMQCQKTILCTFAWLVFLLAFLFHIYLDWNALSFGELNKEPPNYVCILWD